MRRSLTGSDATLTTDDSSLVSVVLPAYGSRDTLEELHRRLSAALAGASLPYELIFVDDACPDGSGAVINELTARDPRVRGIFLSRNVGQQRAVWLGLSAARGAWVVVMDADLQDPPEAIPALLLAATAGVDAVLAAWSGDYEGKGRLLTSRIFKALREMLTGYPRDAGMFFALRRPLVDEIRRYDVPNPFFPSLVGLSGRPLVTVPVERAARPGGGSGYSGTARLLRAARELAFIARLRLGKDSEGEGPLGRRTSAKKGNAVVSHSRFRSYPRLIAGNILILAVLLVLVEGLASYLLLAHDLTALYVPPYRRHTNYDAELGWVDKPNVHIPDLYGPGLSFTTNSAGFRNKREFTVRIPASAKRVVCTGDSFTLGVGVDDDQTWCHLLATLEPRLEAVNMGQPGYGVDQAYLLYKRVGSQLDHNAHLFALIGPDIDRMLSAQFQGYDKPLIDLEHGSLALRNVPVPRRSYVFPWLTDRKAILNALRAAQLARLLRHPATAQRPMASEFTNERDGSRKTREILHLILLDLKRLNRERGSELIIVFLPALADFQPGGVGAWPALIREEARTTEVPLIDVLKRFQELPEVDALKMFILPGQGTYPGVNHLNERGNAFVAKLISAELNARWR